MEISRDVYQWLVDNKLLKHRSGLVEASTSGRLIRLSSEMDQPFQNGYMILTILKGLSSVAGVPLDDWTSDGAIHDATAAPARAYNWKLVFSALNRLGIQTDEDAKELLLQGDLGMVSDLLEQVFSMAHNYVPESLPQKADVAQNADILALEDEIRQLESEGYVDGTLDRTQHTLPVQAQPLFSGGSGVASARTCMDFLVLSLAEAFEIDTKDAVSVITARTKDLEDAVILGEEGGDYTTVLEWYRIMFAHAKHLYRLLGVEPSTLTFTLSTLKFGFLSESMEVCQLCSAVHTYLGSEFNASDSVLKDLAWSWFTENDSGVLEYVLCAIRRHPALTAELMHMIRVWGHGRFNELCRRHAPAVLTDTSSLLSFYEDLMFVPLTANEALVEFSNESDAALPCLLFSDIVDGPMSQPTATSSRLQGRMLAFLERLWEAFPLVVEEASEQCRQFASILKRICGLSSQKPLQVQALGTLRNLIESTGLRRSPFAPVLLKTWLYVMVKVYGNGDIRSLALDGMCDLLNRIDFLPASMIYLAYEKVFSPSASLECDLFFLVTISQHAKFPSDRKSIARQHCRQIVRLLIDRSNVPLDGTADDYWKRLGAVIPYVAGDGTAVQTELFQPAMEKCSAYSARVILLLLSSGLVSPSIMSHVSEELRDLWIQRGASVSEVQRVVLALGMLPQPPAEPVAEVQPSAAVAGREDADDTKQTDGSTSPVTAQHSVQGNAQRDTKAFQQVHKKNVLALKRIQEKKKLLREREKAERDAEERKERIKKQKLEKQRLAARKRHQEARKQEEEQLHSQFVEAMQPSSPVVLTSTDVVAPLVDDLLRDALGMGPSSPKRLPSGLRSPVASKADAVRTVSPSRFRCHSPPRGLLRSYDASQRGVASFAYQIVDSVVATVLSGQAQTTLLKKQEVAHKKQRLKHEKEKRLRRALRGDPSVAPHKPEVKKDAYLSHIQQLEAQKQEERERAAKKEEERMQQLKKHRAEAHALAEKLKRERLQKEKQEEEAKRESKQREEEARKKRRAQEREYRKKKAEQLEAYKEKMKKKQEEEKSRAAEQARKEEAERKERQRVFAERRKKQKQDEEARKAKEEKEKEAERARIAEEERLKKEKLEEFKRKAHEKRLKVLEAEKAKAAEKAAMEEALREEERKNEELQRKKKEAFERRMAEDRKSVLEKAKGPSDEKAQEEPQESSSPTQHVEAADSEDAPAPKEVQYHERKMVDPDTGESESWQIVEDEQGDRDVEPQVSAEPVDQDPQSGDVQVPPADAEDSDDASPTTDSRPPSGGGDAVSAGPPAEPASASETADPTSNGGSGEDKNSSNDVRIEDDPPVADTLVEDSDDDVDVDVNGAGERNGAEGDADSDGADQPVEAVEAEANPEVAKGEPAGNRDELDGETEGNATATGASGLDENGSDNPAAAVEE